MNQPRYAAGGLALFLVAWVWGLSQANGRSPDPDFERFNAIYEPSGVQQLADGRFLVVQDESEHPVDLFRLPGDGRVSEHSLYRGGLFSWTSRNRELAGLEDLEGVAQGRDGWVYAITSHSRKDNGKRAAAREQLLRFRVQGDEVRNVEVVRGLRKRMTRAFTELKAAGKVREVKEDDGFNIEGLAFDAARNRLLVGLRAPLGDEGQALVVVLENPYEMFDKDAEPRFAARLLGLDLDGGGIRGMAYDPHLKGYLILARRPGKSFKLWLWDGDTRNRPRRLKIDGLKNLRQAEGVTPVVRDGLPYGILIVSDDGDALRSKGGRYVLVGYDRLRGP